MTEINYANATIDLSISSDKKDRVILDYKVKSEKYIQTIILYRSYVNLNLLNILDLYEQPITKTVISCTDVESQFVDSLIAHNCSYYYYMKVTFTDSTECNSTVVCYKVPDRKCVVIADKQPILYIDKTNYIIELRYGRAIVKRYPISLGGNPSSRKLYYDCLTTPEGRYFISILKPVSPYHKSIGVSYPNNEDRKRYANERNKGGIPPRNGEIPHIGGSITIHGGGIGNNWTWGCIAMRNSDLDELFESANLKVGVKILISGKEIKREDLQYF